MTVVTITYARTHFSELAARAEAGETVEITRRGKLVARLEPIESATYPVPQPAFALAARYCEMPATGLRAADALHLAVAALGGHALATLDARLAEGRRRWG